MSTRSPSRPAVPALDFSRVIDNQTADALLREHGRWLESGGREGRRANFKNKICRGVDFRRSLAQAQFQGAVLEGCTFRPGVDLTEADFSEANLTAVDLSGTRNLAEHRLGASKLSYAKLPPDFTFQGLDAIKELAARAEKILLALVASCATVIVLTRVIPHGQLFQPAQSLNLPVLGLPVPVRTFFNLAPWLLLVPYSYLLSTLLKLWGAQRDLPAVLPSHRMLFREVPASPNFCVMPFGGCWRRFPHRDRTRRAEADAVKRTTRVDRLLVIVSVWWLVPLTIAWLWVSYLPRHSPVDTFIQVLAVALAVGLSISSYGRMLIHLTRGFRDWTPPIAVPVPWTPRRQIRLSRIKLLLYTDGETPRPRGAPAPATRVRRTQEPGGPRNLRYSLVSACVAAVTLSLGLFSLAMLSASGCSSASRFDKERGVCYWFAANLPRADLDSVELSGQNLRRAFMAGASLKHARLEDARLEGAQLTDADAEDAVLKDAHLKGAVLWEADLEDAVLKEAHLEHADLRGAFLSGARLQGAYLTGADLRGANLTGAILCGAAFPDGSTRLDGVIGRPAGAEVRAEQSHGGFPGEGLGPVRPAYLTDKKDREGYDRWLAAELAVEQLAAYVIREGPSGRLARNALAEGVDRVDLSMGAATQRSQIALDAYLATYAGASSADWVAYTPSLQFALQDFIDDVQRKARNHCVLPASTRLPDPIRYVPSRSGR